MIWKPFLCSVILSTSLFYSVDDRVQFMLYIFVVFFRIKVAVYH